jgi:hypothetical protein
VLFRLLFVFIAACGFRPSATSATDDGSIVIDPDAHVIAIDAPADATIHVGDDAGLPPPPPTDCLDALAHGVTTSGQIMIDPDGAGGNPPFTAYCDQVTAGGGWTLVWVYGFTNYAQFAFGPNAVTPRPTWNIPSGAGTTPTSTTVPTSPTSTGALDFPKWASLGDEVLATSDINHWVKCQPGGGSIVTKTEGTVTCQMVKVVAATCTTTVPAYWGQSDPAGVGFYLSSSLFSTYYFYEGYTTTNNWPTHDPCGTNQANQLNNVANPHGQLWIRRRS